MIPLPSQQETEEFLRKMLVEFQNVQTNKDDHLSASPSESQLRHFSQLYLMAEFGKLTSGMFHDLISPITAVSLHIEELKIQKNHSRKIQGLVDQAFHATKHLEKFLKNIRGQIQNQEEKELFSCAHEIEQAILLLRYQARQEQVEIVSFLEKESLFFGNPIKFQQMIVSLLSNAIDSYDGISGIYKKIEVFLERKETLWILQVKDYGMGIPEMQKQYIFEPLFTTKTSKKGVGIGLCTVKYKVEKEFKGTIEVENNIPQGSIFTLRFPCNEQGLEDDELKRKS